MNHPSPLSNPGLLAISFSGLLNDIVYIVGAITLLLILAFIVMMLTMLPDFVRYLKIKRM